MFRSKDWRGYLQKLRWQAARALAPRRVVTSRGLRFSLQCDNWKTHYRWSTYNTKEIETLDWIDHWVRAGDLFFDIGANIGAYSLYAALRHPKARVVAFEPEYANLHLLKENLIENRLLDRVEVYALALNRYEGISHLHLQDLTGGSALHTESQESLGVTRSGLPVVWREGISVTTLDRFCRQTALQPDLLKIDVDGSELEVLEGGGQTIRPDRVRSILVESDDLVMRQKCSTWLERAGFYRFWKDPLGRSTNEIWASPLDASRLAVLSMA